MRQPIDAIVHLVLPDYMQASVRDAGGYEYVIVPSTPGVPWSELQPGDRVRLWVTPPPVLVERVERA